MDQTSHENKHDTPQKDADLLQVAAVALQRCTGDDTPAEQLLRLMLLSYQQCKGLLTPASIAEPLESFRRQSKANVEAARQIAKLKPWLLQATDAELAEELSFDLDDHTEPSGGNCLTGTASSPNPKVPSNNATETTFASSSLRPFLAEAVSLTISEKLKSTDLQTLIVLNEIFERLDANEDSDYSVQDLQDTFRGALEHFRL